MRVCNLHNYAKQDTNINKTKWLINISMPLQNMLGDDTRLADGHFIPQKPK